jgi:hypothetical protein
MRAVVCVRLYWFCHIIGTDASTIAARSALPKGTFPFFIASTAFGAVLQCGEVSDIVIQHSHTRDMLPHCGPLGGLAHRLLFVELLTFGSISSEDRELMQLEMVSESSPHAWTFSFGNFTVYSSPKVTLVHLAANAILLGLCVTRQEVSQKLVLFGDCLIVSLLGFMEHLFGLLNLQFAGPHIIIGGDGSLGPSSLQEILQHSCQLVNSLGRLPALHAESLLADEM